MGYRAQIFERMTLLLERIVGSRRSLQFDFVAFHLEGLLSARGESNFTGADEGRADVLLYRFLIIIQLVGFEDHLKAVEA